jgi:hypothetical protein
VAADPAVANYSVTLNIPPNAVDEGDPGSNVVAQESVSEADDGPRVAE